VIDHLLDLGDAFLRDRNAAQLVAHAAQRRQPVFAVLQQVQHAPDHVIGDAAGAQLFFHAVQADLVQLVDAAVQVAGLRLRHARVDADPVQDLAVVDVDGEIGKAQPPQRGGEQADDLGVGGHARHAHDVHVALVELAVAALLGPVAAPHGRDVIAPEGHREVVFVHRHVARQRHRQVIAQRELFLAAGVLRVEDQLVGFFAGLAQQGIEHFERGRGDRLEAERLEHVRDHAEDVLALQYFVRQKVAHPFRQPGVDRGHGHPLLELDTKKAWRPLSTLLTQGVRVA